MYSHPELAWCGLTEEQARELGHDVVTTTHRFAGDGRALILGETEGLVKLVADADGLLLGVHVVGPVGDRAARRGLPRGELGGERGRRRRARAPAPDPQRGVRRGRARADRATPALTDTSEPRPDDRRTAWT